MNHFLLLFYLLCGWPNKEFVRSFVSFESCTWLIALSLSFRQWFSPPGHRTYQWGPHEPLSYHRNAVYREDQLCACRHVRFGAMCGCSCWLLLPEGGYARVHVRRPGTHQFGPRCAAAAGTGHGVLFRFPTALCHHRSVRREQERHEVQRSPGYRPNGRLRPLGRCQVHGLQCERSADLRLSCGHRQLGESLGKNSMLDVDYYHHCNVITYQVTCYPPTHAAACVALILTRWLLCIWYYCMEVEKRFCLVRVTLMGIWDVRFLLNLFECKFMRFNCPLSRFPGLLGRSLSRRHLRRSSLLAGVPGTSPAVQCLRAVPHRGRRQGDGPTGWQAGGGLNSTQS